MQTAKNLEDQNKVTPEEEKRYRELLELAAESARYGDTEALESMIDAGINPDLKDAKGSSLLMLASYNGNLDTSRMLLKRGAKVDLKNDRGQTPLGGAAFKGDPEIVQLLIEYNADVNADNGGGKTPLMFATMFGRLKARRILKSHGAKYWNRG